MKRFAAEIAVILMFVAAICVAAIRPHSATVIEDPMSEVKNLPTESPLVSGFRNIQAIVVHHSASSSGNVEVFRNFHINKRGWDDVGYHYIITNGQGGLDGEVQIGRLEHIQGAHDKHRNEWTIGICLVGNDSFSEKQIQSLISLLSEICDKYGIEPSVQTILPHHEECPGHGLDLEFVVNQVSLL